MFLKKKRNFHETVHDGTVGIRETTGMKSRFVGHRFLKQGKNCVND